MIRTDKEVEGPHRLCRTKQIKQQIDLKPYAYTNK